MLPAKFQINWPFGSGEEAKNRFSSWPPPRQSSILDRKDFSYFWSTSHLDTSKRVSSQVAFRFRWKIYFQDGRHGGHLGYQIGMILANFDLHVTLMLPTKFQVNWHFGSGEEEKNRFSRWPPWWSSWISDRSDFHYFWSTSHPDASYQVSSQMAQGCRRSRLLKQTVDAAGCTMEDRQKTDANRHWSIIILNSLPWS